MRIPLTAARATAALAAAARATAALATAALAAAARATAALAATVLAAAALAIAPGAASATPMPRASLTDVEDGVMCLVCHTPLAVSESPQANAERDFIRALIARGETKAQIDDALVAQYGPGVLALPRAHGFNLTIYVLPPALVLLGVAILAFTLPRWRRRARARAAIAAPSGQTLDPADARRLDEELARYR
jgi:cytochrome c-type biogenesis protein CcmH/NrfF